MTKKAQNIETVTIVAQGGYAFELIVNWNSRLAINAREMGYETVQDLKELIEDAMKKNPKILEYVKKDPVIYDTEFLIHAALNEKNKEA